MRGVSWLVGAVSVLVAGPRLAAQNPVPVQIDGWAAQPVDTTKRLELTGGHAVTYTVKNTGQTGGPDAKVAFTCSVSGGGTVTACPGDVFIAPGGGDERVVTVTVTLGSASPNTVTLIATAVGPGPTGSSHTMNSQLTVVLAQATITPNPAAAQLVAGFAGNQAFTIQNTGQLATTYTLALIPTQCTQSGLANCTVSVPSVGPLAPGATGNFTVTFTGATYGSGILDVEARQLTRVVQTARVNVRVLDADLSPRSPQTTAPAGSTGNTYSGFLLTGTLNQAFELAITSCPVGSSCTWVGGPQIISHTVGTTGVVAVPALQFTAPTSGMGRLIFQVRTGATVLDTDTLVVQALVAPTVTPRAAAITAAPSATGTYSGFALTGTPNTGYVATLLSCSLSACGFTVGAAPATITTDAAGTAAIGVNYTALPSGSGRMVFTMSAGGTVFSTDTLTVTTVVTPSVSPPNTTTTAPTGSTGNTFSGFTLTGMPNADYTLTMTGCTLITGCAFTAGASPATVTTNASGSATLGLTFNAPVTGTGRFIFTVRTGATTWSTDTLTVVVSANPVVTPLHASTTALAGSGLKTYTGFAIAGAPTTAYVLRIQTCQAPLTNCGFGGGPSPWTVTTGPTGAMPFTVQYYAGPTAGTTGRVIFQLTNAAQTTVYTTDTLTVTMISGPSVSLSHISYYQDTALYRGACVSLGLGGDAGSECGDLRLSHALPAVRTMDQVRVPMLTYSSASARPFPVISIYYVLGAGSTLPTSVTGTLYVNGVARATGSWPSSEFTAGSTRRLTLGFDAGAAGLATGLHAYQFTVTSVFPSGTVNSGLTGTTLVVNRMTSPFGAGWWLAGLERLDLTNAERPIWYGGDGSHVSYTRRVGTFAPNRVWGGTRYTYPDTIREVGGEFVRQLPDSVWVYFNAQGQHVRTRNRLGHVTTFAYDGSGRLSQITLSPTASPLSYTFHYGSGGLDSVRAPGLTSGTYRTVKLTRNGATNTVTSILDPGTPTRSIAFGYAPTDRRILTRTNGRGFVATFRYDVMSKVDSAGFGGVTRRISNWQSAGGPGATAPFNLFKTVLTGPRAGQVTQFEVDYRGAPTRIIDALNQVTEIARGNGNFQGLVTRVTPPSGATVTAIYDTRGRLVTQTAPAPDGSNATTTYTWHATWDALTRILPPTGDSTRFGVDPASGNRTWQEDARGTLSRVGFRYNAARQLEYIDNPDGTEQFLYRNPQGNVTDTYNELDQHYAYLTNAAGLVREERRPTGNTQPYTPNEITKHVLGTRGELLADTLIGTAGERQITTQSYDAEGNVLTVTRSWSPNPRNIPAQTTTFTYDAFDRVATKTESSGGMEVMGYDDAGNLTGVTTRRGDGITMGYDLLNRMTSRGVPAGAAYAYPGVQLAPPIQVNMSMQYAYGLSGVSETFTYDANNQILTAVNADAAVTRTYHQSGAMLSETMAIKSRDRASSHVYGVTYTYDASGRRTSRTLTPSTLFPGVAQQYTYYNWGGLASVKDVEGNSFAFTYDNRGRLTTLTRPGSVVQTLGYDLASGLTSDVINRPGGSNAFPFYPNPLRQATLTRNGRNAIRFITETSGLSPELPSTGFDGFGRLVSSRMKLYGATYSSYVTTFESIDTTTYDALGNILTQSGGWSVPGTASTYSTTNTFDNANRLTSQLRITGGGGTVTAYQFDAAGNTVFDATRPSGQSLTVSERAAYYRGDDKLMAVDQRTAKRLLLEEYRYDALGRRIWVSTRRSCSPSDALECYTNHVRRIIWDGSSELAEVRAPIFDGNPAIEELDSGWPSVGSYTAWQGGDAGDPNAFIGRVAYGPGLAIDQPLSVTRYDYRDQPSGASAPTIWPTFTLMPLWDYRGTAAFGVFTDGAWAKILQPQAGQASCPAVGLNVAHRCIPIQWPMAQSPYDKSAARALPAMSWMGSVIDGKRDASGLDYARNRMYDPKTGRFTQEDPIGLAGGLNLYGYANGDPVNFSDPFGLAPCKDAQGKAIPCPEPSGGPPVPLPEGRRWKPAGGGSTPSKEGGSRGRRWVPTAPIPGGVPQPGSSWDPEFGHWDVDNLPGSRGRRRFDEKGVEVTHDGDPVFGPQQFPPTSAARAAGTVTAGVITYWIISELTRLFPPRNLVPIPEP